MSRVLLASGIEIPAKPRHTQVLGHEDTEARPGQKRAAGRTTPPHGERTTAPTRYGGKREAQTRDQNTQHTHNGRGTQEKGEQKNGRRCSKITIVSRIGF